MLIAPPLWPGTYIKSITQNYINKNDWYYESVAIDQGKMRIDIQGSDLLAAMLSKKKDPSPNQPMSTWTVLFDQTTSQLDLVLPSSKAVYELTGEDFTQIKAFLAPFVPEMQKALKDGPKLKKKDKADFQEAQKTLAQILDYPSAPAASGVSIDGYICDKYVFRSQNKKLMDYWCLPSSAMPMSHEDYQTSKALLDLFVDVGADFIAGLGLDPEKIKNHPYLSTFPVCYISYNEKGKPANCYRVLAVKSESFPPETFDIPATYAKTDVLSLVKALGMLNPKGKTTAAATPAAP